MGGQAASSLSRVALFFSHTFLFTPSVYQTVVAGASHRVLLLLFVVHVRHNTVAIILVLCYDAIESKYKE